ncbi:HAMP domain-containing sensor histidine kinase [Flavobacterium sp.]|uniref:sensor histidine kinase n=1 Tax=Flavobacterium sp. TaxID=239 RepID=UPI00262A4550|nr:HAMP domain-containing sensor histidine kinase [Flavobacterium sp.]
MKAVFKIVFLSFLCCFQFALAQQNYSPFEKEIIAKSKPLLGDPDFAKAQGFFLQKEWDSCFVYTLKQLSIENQKKEIQNFCHFFRGFGFKAKKLFKESKKEFQFISNDFPFHNHIKMFLGEIALEEKQFNTAIHYFNAIEQLHPDLLLGIKKSSVKHNLGLCYLHLEKYDKAEHYLLEELQLEEAQNDTAVLVGSYGDIATLYYDQYKDKLAIPYFEKAYHLSKKVNNYQLKQNAALNMAVVEENRKDYIKALTYRKEYEQWKDSLNDQNKVWEVAQLEKQFTVKQKQKEVSLLKAENKIKIAERNGLLYSAIILLLLLGTAVYFYREKTKNNKIILAQKEALSELNATKDKLFSIVSHDLRSAVNALKISNAKLLENLAAKNLDELDSLLQRNSAIANGTYNLLDNLLHWALLQTKQSYFEITAIRLYHCIEQMAYNYQPLMLEKNLVFENTVSKNDFVCADQESLKIILRNFIDNAIKFSNENGFIKIYTQNTDEKYCTLIIEDNGIGMDAALQTALLNETTLLSKTENEAIVGTGLGMQLCKSLIQKNNGKLDLKSDVGKGTKIIVSLIKKQSNG